MPPHLTDAQLRAELARCQSCETKPCRGGCPANLSPADFILAARCGEPSDLRRAADHILSRNPLGGVCGQVCPDTLCMARCARRALDGPVNIPAIQAAIVERARALGLLRPPERPPATGHRVAVVGAGPAGLGAAAVLARAGHAVHLFDGAPRAGGMARLIPGHRLDAVTLEADLAALLGLGDVHLVLGEPVALPRDLLARGFAAVVVAVGLGDPVALDVPGARRALPWTALLGDRPPPLRGRRVAVVGGGAAAVDCAEAALAQGAAHVELLALESLSELGLPRRERDRLFASGIHVSGRVRVTAILGRAGKTTGVALRKVELPAGQAFHPSRLVDLRHADHERRDLDVVVVAAGSAPGLRRERHPRVFYAGDLASGPSSVVEALASGMKAGRDLHALLAGDDLAACPDRPSCPEGGGACPKRATCPEWSRPASTGAARGGGRLDAGLPVPLTSDFFGREIGSPFLLAATPTADGYALLRRGYEAGWAGGVLRSAPGHTPDRLLGMVGRLRHEFPDRLTLAAVGLAVDGGGAELRAALDQVRRLEAAGAMGIELSLAALPPETHERVIEAVLSGSDGSVPKLFEVDAAAAAVAPAMGRIGAALVRHAGRPAGVTLGGAARHGVGPGALHAFAAAVRHGVTLSCDAAFPDYLAAARALARGARTAQFGALARSHGLGVVSELHAGLSWFLADRGLRSVAELVGSAPTADAAPDEAPGTRSLCAADPARCTGCGNCTRCPHLAIALDARGLPAVDPSRCTGCALCVERCFVGALSMRPVEVAEG